MSHTVISRAPRHRSHLALIDAIAHADDIDQVNTLVNQAGYETYEEFWTACEAEFAAR
jgi:short-subunit dehydrogenase